MTARDLVLAFVGIVGIIILHVISKAITKAVGKFWQKVRPRV